MRDGPYVIRTKETKIFYVLVTIIYHKGKLISYSEQIVDKKSTLSEKSNKG